MLISIDIVRDAYIDEMYSELRNQNIIDETIHNDKMFNNATRDYRWSEIGSRWDSDVSPKYGGNDISAVRRSNDRDESNNSQVTSGAETEFDMVHNKINDTSQSQKDLNVHKEKKNNEAGRYTGTDITEIHSTENT